MKTVSTTFMLSKRGVEWVLLKNAPIAEALLDLRLKPEIVPNKNVFERFNEAISQDYPQGFEKHSFQRGFQLSQTELPKVIKSEYKAKGCRYNSKDGKHIVEVDDDGFTFHRLRPYENWKNFLTEFKRWWEVYKELVGPARIRRIGLRYINRIELPLPFNDFNEYILTGPQIADKLPQGIMELFMRLMIPDSQLEVLGIVTQATAPIKEDKLPLIFDIDAFRNINVESTDKEIWEVIENLRCFKNDIFFGSVTEKAINLFQ